MTFRIRSTESRRPLPQRAALAAAVSALVLVATAPADAQLVGLRGEVSEADVRGALLSGQPQTSFDNGSTRRSATAVAGKAAAPGSSGDLRPQGIQPAPFQPSSPGAVPDETDDSADGADPDDSLFDADEADFQSEPAARPAARTLSTAAKRAEAEKARRTGKPDASTLRITPTQRAMANPSLGEPEEADADAAGTARQERVDAQDQELNRRVRADSAAAQAIESHAIEPEDNPFAPVGTRIGNFVLRSSLEQGLTYTNNANSTPEGGKALLSESTLRLNAISERGGNLATIDAYGTYLKTLSGEDVSDPSGGVSARLELDLGHEMRGIASLAYVAQPESASSPVEIIGTLSKPLNQILDASLGVAKDEGKLRYGITGKVERLTYGDAELSGGGSISQKDRNSTLGSVVLRGGYELSPALVPFVEGEIGRRIYDVSVDANGNERSANRLAARAGLEIDLREKLRGEIALGWVSEKLDDPALKSISAPSFSADLTWSPHRDTTVNLFGTTIVEGTTDAGQSGSVLYSATASATRLIRSDLTGRAALDLGWRDYVGSDGHDLILGAEGSLTWWLNRYLGLTGRLRHEKVDSNLPGRTTKTDSAFLGVTLQR